MTIGRTDGGALVLLMLSAGPDALVVHDVPSALKMRGKKGIALQALRELVGRRPLPRLEVTVGDVRLAGGWVIVGNGRCYAGPFHATPGAEVFRDGFDVVVQRGSGRPAALAFAGGIALGRHLRLRGVDHLTAERIAVLPLSDRVPYQIDGDFAGWLPVTVSTDPRRLVVRLPAREVTP
jgi:diacylglycerol kinase family enzyme